MNEWQERGKESSPEKTVEKINGIINRLGYKINIKEFDIDVKNCYSCRLTLEGEMGEYIGSNGKGMSRALCLASAHGELIERLASRIFATAPRYDDDKPDELMIPAYPKYFFKDEDQEEVIIALRERIAKTVKTPLFMMTPLEFVDSMLEKIVPHDENGGFGTLPFYSMRKKKMVYLPAGFLYLFTGSNGLAAGNTYEEALVEGLSEILERYSEMKILDGGIVPPEIPDEVIDKYPRIRSIINDIEKDPRYKVRVLDASLGKGLPVVCGVIINRMEGRFGMKLGSHPNMSVALERVFTEAFQGAVLEQFSIYNTPDFTAVSIDKRVDKWNTMKVGVGNIACEVLMDDASYEFKPWKDVSAMGNREKMFMLMDLIESLGGDIYVHDEGYLGFPVVQIYAAGVSEPLPVDLSHLKVLLLGNKVRDHFLKLDSLTDEEVEEIALYARCKEGAILENTISMISGLCYKDKMPGAPFEAEFLHAACIYRLGRFKEAAELFERLKAMEKYMDPDTSLFNKAVRIYVQGMSSGMEEKKVYSVLKSLCPQKAEKVRDIFIDRMHCLGKIYPSIGGDKLTHADKKVSDYSLIHDFYARLVAEENKNMPDPEVMMKLLERG